MMLIETFRDRCPCGHPIAIRGHSGGRYALTCPACRRLWSIVPARVRALGSDISVIGFGTGPSRRPLPDAVLVEG
jgi:hypothetical protein